MITAAKAPYPLGVWTRIGLTRRTHLKSGGEWGANVSSDELTGTRSSGPGGVPRWVVLTTVVVALLLAIVLLVLIFGSGEHGPGRHMG